MSYFGVFLNMQREILPVTHPNEVLEFPYQLINTSQEPRLAEDVKGLIGKILPACSFKEFDFQLKYHGRIYNGSIEDSHAIVEKPEAYPPRVTEGAIRVKLEFSRGENKLNDRLVRRLTSDIKPIIPYQRQSPKM
jgi:hypothetical protein